MKDDKLAATEGSKTAAEECAVAAAAAGDATLFGSAAAIAGLEFAYWRDLPEPSSNVEFLTGCQYGGMGAAANICGALAQGKTVAEFEADLARRGVLSPALPEAAEPSRPVPPTTENVAAELLKALTGAVLSVEWRADVMHGQNGINPDPFAHHALSKFADKCRVLIARAEGK